MATNTTVYYKVIGRDSHIKYTLGVNTLNTYLGKFCKSSWYTTFEHIGAHITDEHGRMIYGDRIAVLQLCEDSYCDPKVYKDTYGATYWVTNKFNITKIYKVNEFVNMYPMELIMQNSMTLYFVQNQTLEQCVAAVNQNGLAIHHVKNQTLGICMVAIQQNALTMVSVQKQTYDLCIMAVRYRGCTLQGIKKQTCDLCMAAVQQNGCALQYVKRQTQRLCEIAVQQNWRALRFVRQQTPEICAMAIMQNKFAHHYVAIEYQKVLNVIK